MRTLVLLLLAASAAAALDLTNASVVAPDLQGREKKALELLLDEVEARTQIRWDAAASAGGWYPSSASAPAPPDTSPTARTSETGQGRRYCRRLCWSDTSAPPALAALLRSKKTPMLLARPLT